LWTSDPEVVGFASRVCALSLSFDLSDIELFRCYFLGFKMIVSHFDFGIVAKRIASKFNGI